MNISHYSRWFCCGISISIVNHRLSDILNFATFIHDIIKVVAFEDIASYLLITPNHLSRIRRNLAAGIKE